MKWFWQTGLNNSLKVWKKRARKLSRLVLGKILKQPCVTRLWWKMRGKVLR
jgi:hypothetical protein